MAGHSHWASIKHKKGATDAKKGKAFSKIARMITVAARKGGGQPDMNPKLQLAIDKARAVNMPKDNIERAIQKGTRAGDNETELFECIYEGYGPQGIALMVEILTDNKNRTVPEIRKIFEKYGGNMGESGCVSWMFEKKGLIMVNGRNLNEDEFMMLALEAGAEDIQKVGDIYQVICQQADLNTVKKNLMSKNITVESTELAWMPKSNIDLDEASGRKVLGLMEALEEHDDVQNVYSNFNLPQSLLAELQSAK
ncbi:MAG TPA: YebC/PmpR family DNA-binding transcriptional regulator [Candidatus Wujingus californicus]|uniref:YebC/PmpR family DNA-binding transcriptional regulator n=1 Tax=Candidatus Wujingus californicus TaxID=3367618 RepID=UPI001DC11021|nr:YebC/PmpR family DNA-binding transcriptional regulator [Planctomycetota bacterium]MDO8130418.1 YebC/PmpR family DNA-binding transcriptional regulator [Candidatus Brocadiales bacterium]